MSLPSRLLRLPRLLPRRPTTITTTTGNILPRCPPTRPFSSTPAPPQSPLGSGSSGKYKTIQQAKSRYRSGPFSWKAGLLFLVSGGLLIQYFRLERARMERQRIAEQGKSVGKPKVGGEFTLKDMYGKEVDEGTYRGRYMLVYFGFTHCPDICPEELDKMAAMLDLVEKKCGNVVTPLFITCDPARDTPQLLREYLSEFHPKFIGLTGTYDQIKSVCKAYRVYFSTPPVIKPGQDYLVDHSIYFYLMDPDGDFVEALGRQHTPEGAAEVITAHIKDWKKPMKEDVELYAHGPAAGAVTTREPAK